MSGTMVQRLSLEASIRGAPAVEKALAGIENKAATTGKAMDAAAGKLGTTVEGTGKKISTLSEFLTKNKQAFTATTAASFALTAAMASGATGMTKMLTVAGAMSVALAGIPGPIGVIMGVASTLFGILGTLSQAFGNTAKATEKADEAMKGYTDTIQKMTGDLGPGATLQQAMRYNQLVATELDAAKRQAEILEALDTAASSQYVLERELRRAKEAGHNIDELIYSRRLKRQKEVIKGLNEEFEARRRNRIDLDKEMGAVKREAAIRSSPFSLLIKEKKEEKKKEGKEKPPMTAQQIVDQPLLKGVAEAIGISPMSADEKAAEAIEQLRYKREAAAVDERIKLGKMEREERKKLAKDEMEESRKSSEALADKGKAYYDVAVAAIMSGDSVVGAIKKQLNAEAQAAALEAGFNALKYGALSIARYAMGDPVGGSAFAKSAAMFVAEGALAAGVTAATGGFGSGSSTSGSSSPSSSSDLTGVTNAKKEEQAYTINLNFAGQPLHTKKEIQMAVGEALDYERRRNGSRVRDLAPR